MKNQKEPMEKIDLTNPWTAHCNEVRMTFHPWLKANPT